ncbi:MAG TPA: fumarylacetoacetate hydrolase family protein [Bryobacteraceae bacterium]|nr:fumarylacetoacetate hydrolase family protein [Bryobacteraceae bacterium]
MRFGQIRFENKLTAALFEDGAARPIPGYTTVEMIRKSETEAIPLSELLQEMAIRHREPILPAIPISPVEVWACGCTYAPSASFRDGQHGNERGIYDYVLSSERPEIFFKGTARVCVGPGQPIGIRPDSKFTAPEPEFAVVLGRKGSIVGYTLANDVSAWDIERENPLYLPQSKIYSGCCALGPVIITPDELPDLREAHLECTITRGGVERFSGSTTVSNLCRPIEYLIEYLLRANPVPAGSVLLTGTGIIVPEDSALAPGDTVAIRMAQIGEFANPAAIVQ